MNYFVDNSKGNSHESIIHELFDIESYPLFPSIKALVKDTVSLLEFLYENLQFKGCFSSRVKGMKVLSATSIMSAISTLSSICNCLMLNSIGDAFMLLRRYRDTLFQYAFVLHTTENYDPLRGKPLNYLKGQDINDENFVNMMLEYIHALAVAGGENRSDRENAVEIWLDADALSKPNERGTRKEFFDYSHYMKGLRDEPKIKECIDVYFSDGLRILERKFNDFTHINGVKFAEQNMQRYNNESNSKYQEEMRTCLESITLAFLSILILIEPTAIRSSDYMDAVELDLTPISDSQYWVAPLVNEYLALYRDKHPVSLKRFLFESNRYSMQIK